MIAALVVVGIVVAVYALIFTFCAGSSHGYTKAEREMEEDKGQST